MVVTDVYVRMQKRKAYCIDTFLSPTYESTCAPLDER